MDVRFAACGAISKWLDMKSYPVDQYVTTYDDILVWRIPLCRTCIPSGYQSFLRNRLKKVAIPLGVSSFLLAVGALVLIRSLQFGIVLICILLVSLIVGAVGVPIYLVMLIVNLSRWIGFLKRSGEVPAKWIHRSFIGEGQRIINALMPGRGKPRGKVWGEFLLPVHKPLDQAEVAPDKRKNLGNPTCEMDIVAVGKTISEMEKQLPSQWKPLWERRYKNQPENGQTR